MTSRTHLLVLTFMLSLPVPAMAGKPTLADIFNSGMVLQRDLPIRVWGSADDGTKVTVALGKASVQTVAADGRWQLALPARKASSGPLSMAVRFAGAHAAEVRIDNVVVGEVWLCAGQSNMAGVVGKRNAGAPQDKEMPLVCQFGRPRGAGYKNPPTWMIAEGDAAANFSAVAFYHGQALHQRLKVPIGLIVAAVSGSPIENWVPKSVLEADPQTRAIIDRSKDRDTRSKVRAFDKEVKAGRRIRDSDRELLTIRSLRNYGRLYAQHIQPTVPYGIRGVIWYQGEANSRHAFNARRYGSYLSMLIGGLREAYRQPKLPFYVVQLPSIGRSRKDAGTYYYNIVRQQQLEAVSRNTNTGLAVTIDIDEGLHPRSKHVVGDRLARLAINEVYGIGDRSPYCGPLLAGVTFSRSAATCSFRHADGGLVLVRTDKNLFEIAGADGVFHPARARISGRKLILSSDKVAGPTSVRYAYHNQMDEVSLFGSTKLPASPFVYP